MLVYEIVLVFYTIARVDKYLEYTELKFQLIKTNWNVILKVLE